MEKARLTFLCLFVAFTSQIAYSQTVSLVDDASSNIYSIDKVLDVDAFNHLKSKSLSEDEKSIAYDLSIPEDFGMYVNPFDNQVKFKQTTDVLYTRVQFNDVATGQKVLVESDKNGIESLDLSELEPGSYHIILTDTEYNIFSETITVY